MASSTFQIQSQKKKVKQRRETISQLKRASLLYQKRLKPKKSTHPKHPIKKEKQAAYYNCCSKFSKKNYEITNYLHTHTHTSLSCERCENVSTES